MDDKKTNVATGGNYVGGNVNTGGGDFTGRDKIVHGDEVHGDKTDGDKIAVGDINGSTGVAIGRNAQVSVTEYARGSEAEAIIRAFDELKAQLDRLAKNQAEKQLATMACIGLEEEALKGDGANEETVQTWFQSLAAMGPDILEVAVDTFMNPIKGLSTVFRKIAEKARQEKGGLG